MRQARRAPVGLVEMDMALDEGGQQKAPAEIDALIRRSRASRFANRGDPAIGDCHVAEAFARKASVGDNHQTKFSRFAAAYL
jgi:hypothetical protein